MTEVKANGPKGTAENLPAMVAVDIPRIAHIADIGHSEADLAHLHALAGSAGALRRVALAVAGPMVERRGWERLGFARVGDYARERLGLSGRTLLEWARVERSLGALPRLEAALASARLPWSKVRLLARFARPDDEARWIAHAASRPVRALERELRAVDRAALPESGALATPPDSDCDLDEDGLTREARECIRVRVPTRVAFAWNETCRVAAQVAGERIPRDVALELVTAEVLSALPAGGGRKGRKQEPEAGSQETLRLVRPSRETDDTVEAESGPPSTVSSANPPSLPAFLEPFVTGLDDADPFELDARLRRIVRLSQRLDAEIAPLLRRLGARSGGVSGAVRNVEALARERLGLSPRKARALARLDRLGDDCPALRRAFREARLSWVQAQVLAPLFVNEAPGHDDARERWSEAWVAFAERVTVRRLEDGVARALATGERDPERVDAALDAREERLTPDDDGGSTGVISDPLGPTGGGPAAPWPTCARPRDPDDVVRITIQAPRDVAQLFRATLASVRKRLESEWGRLPSEPEAFEAMIEHARATWETEDPALRRYRKRHRVFVRDGWQCTVPGCRSRRNLQAHHIVFRSAGGSDEPSNQTTLCAFHHHRGVHAGRVAIHGRAPGALDFGLGLRANHPPLIRYRSGDRIAPSA